MPFRLGPTELIIILVIVMIVFGVGRLAEVGSSMGKAIRAFRRGQSGEDEEQPLEETKSSNGTRLHASRKGSRKAATSANREK